MTMHVSRFAYVKLGLYVAALAVFCLGMLAYQFDALPLLVGVLV